MAPLNGVRGLPFVAAVVDSDAKWTAMKKYLSGLMFDEPRITRHESRSVYG